MRILFRAEHSAVSYSQHLEQLDISAFVTIGYKEFLCLRLRVAFVYKYKHTHLENSLPLSQFR